MSATAGKVVLATNQTTIPAGTSCPGGSSVLDLTGYGTGTNCFERTGPTPTLTNATAALRARNGCIDTDDSAADFATGAPNPRNTASPLGNCNDDPPSVVSTTPANAESGIPAGSNIDVTLSEPVNVDDGWYTVSCALSGLHTASVSGGPTAFTLDPDADFASSEPCTITIGAAHVTDQDTLDPPDTMAADFSFTFDTVPPVPIHDIQGAAHLSPLRGDRLATLGVVTAKSSTGFWVQDPNPDSNDATSEGVFVFTSSPPSTTAGDSVRVTGRVNEFRPGSATNANLTTTELGSPTVAVLSHGSPLPPPVVIGTGGRTPPDQVIDDDATGSVETSGSFDPATDGIDFYESLEGMRVQLKDAVAVGPTNSFGETSIIGDNGANASVRTIRGGILLRPNDGNPERVVADDSLTPMPSLNVGDHYSGPIVGVLDYNFGNFFVEVTNPVTRVADGVMPEATEAPSTRQVAVATFNFENLAATDPQQSKFDHLATLVVNNLHSPDLIAGEEVQDDNGAIDDGTVGANATLTRLVAAIHDAGGPTYEWREIDPVDDEDGGQPGGNIRQVFLFRTDRGLSFVDRPGGTSTGATGVTGSGTSTHLTFSPGRIDPTNAAFDDSRKPLAGEFLYRGHKLFVIANHFNSKGGDDPLFGRFQPPTRSSEVQRHQQAQIVNGFVDSVLSGDPGANVVVLGDLNDFEFSDTVSILKGGILHDLMDTLPLNERYSYDFEGNSQVLDHILFSDALFGRSFTFDPVHVNAEFADQASDHDPSVVRIALNDPPSADAGGAYTVNEGGSIGLTADGSDPEGGALSYAWDLDDDGTFETSGQSPTFSAAALDGPSTRTVGVQVTDDVGLTSVDSATLSVLNAAPTATLDAPVTTFAGFPFTLALTSPSDPSAADTSAGFTYAFDCGGGSGYGAFGPSSSASCATTDTGTRSVRAKIRDKDGGVTEYLGTVQVIVTFDSLCSLVRSYARHTDDADELCAILRDAANATNPKTRANILKSFRKTVDGMTGPEPGKSFTQAQADDLKLLSTRLP